MRFSFSLILLFLSQVILAQPSGDTPEPKNEPYSSEFYFQNGRMGLLKSKGKPITPAVYDTLYSTSTGHYIAKRHNLTKKQSFWGIIDNKGQILLPLKYRKLTVSHSLAIVGLQLNNMIKYGVYSLNGDKIIANEYKAIEVPDKNYIIIRQPPNILIFNHDGVKLTQLSADSIALLNSNYLKYYQNGKAGIFNIPMGIAEKVEYDDIRIRRDEIQVKKLPVWNIYINYDTLTYHYENIRDWGDNLIVSNKGKSWVINKANIDISKAYDSLLSISPNLLLAKNRGKWGVISDFGKEILAIKYQYIFNSDDILYAKGLGNDSGWAIFDNYGFIKSKHRYDSVLKITQGRIAVKRNGKWGFLDRYGNEIITPIFDAVKQFKNDKSIVTFFGEDGIINRHGTWVFPPTTLKILDYNSSTILGKINGLYQVRQLDNNELVYFTRNHLSMDYKGFIESDSAGNTIRFINWDGTFQVNSGQTGTTMTGGAGLIIFKKNNRYGFKDQQGRIVIANRYEDVKPFHEGMAAIKINNKWGFINTDEQIIVQPHYATVGYFIDALCIVKKNGLFGVVNKKGRIVVPNRFSTIEFLSNGKLRVEKDGKWGILNENGSILIPPKYTQLISITENLFIVQRNHKYGTISSTGISVMPLIYDFITYSEKSRAIITKQSYKNEWTFLRKVHSN